MHGINNKNLYQILGVDKNASQEQINSLVLKTSPKDNSEIGKALMVLSDPQKKIEYDKNGWKFEWEGDWQKESDFRHSIFEAIQNYKHHYGNTYALKPDGFRVYVWDTHHLDPNLWAPSNGWVDRIWDIRGPNWKQKLENFKNKMLVALDEAWEREKKTPLLGNCWEAVESGNCAKCGKAARLRRKGKHSDGKDYCSQECYFENQYKVPKYEFQKIKYEIPETPRLEKYICVECHYKGYDCYEMDDGSFRCKACFDKELEKLKNSFKKNDSPTERESNEKCDYCGKKIKYQQEGNSHVFKGGIVSVDSEGNRHKFCSKECSEKFRGWEKVVVRKDAFTQLLKWMEKEGITNIGLDPQSKKLVVEYGKNNLKIIEDDNLTPEQREIKNFFQQSGMNNLSQEQVREEATKEKNKNGDGNKWIGPVIIIAVVALFAALIGVIVYKNKKKGY